MDQLDLEEMKELPITYPASFKDANYRIFETEFDYYAVSLTQLYGAILCDDTKEWLQDQIDEEHETTPFFRSGTDYEIDCSVANHQSFYDCLYSQIYEMDDYAQLTEAQQEDYIELVNEYIYQYVKEIIEKEEETL